MIKTNKTELIAGAMIALGIGGMAGNMLSDQEYVALRKTTILEMEGFIFDMQEDIDNGAIDSVPGGYYIHNFSVIHEQLTYNPQEYTEWYEQNNKTSDEYNARYSDSSVDIILNSSIH